jgi:ribonuclease HI
VSGCLYLSNSHRFKFNVGLGECSNNYVDFMALRLPQKCALENNVRHIQICGDSTLVINWINGTTHLHEIASCLGPLENN